MNIHRTNTNNPVDFPKLKMNKRIRELADQAGLLVHNPEGIPSKLEKFAELLVCDCSNTIQEYVAHRIPASEYSVRIKGHYGVRG